MASSISPLSELKQEFPTSYQQLVADGRKYQVPLHPASLFALGGSVASAKWAGVLSIDEPLEKRETFEKTLLVAKRLFLLTREELLKLSPDRKAPRCVDKLDAEFRIQGELLTACLSEIGLEHLDLSFLDATQLNCAKKLVKSDPQLFRKFEKILNRIHERDHLICLVRKNILNWVGLSSQNLTLDDLLRFDNLNKFVMRLDALTNKLHQRLQKFESILDDATEKLLEAQERMPAAAAAAAADRSS
jgi:hypothetical protein